MIIFLVLKIWKQFTASVVGVTFSLLSGCKPSKERSSISFMSTSCLSTDHSGRDVTASVGLDQLLCGRHPSANGRHADDVFMQLKELFCAVPQWCITLRLKQMMCAPGKRMDEGVAAGGGLDAPHWENLSIFTFFFKMERTGWNELMLLEDLKTFTGTVLRWFS